MRFFQIIGILFLGLYQFSLRAYEIKYNLGDTPMFPPSLSEYLLPSRHLSMSITNQMSFPIIVYLSSHLCGHFSLVPSLDNTCLQFSLMPGEQVAIDDIRDVIYHNLQGRYAGLNYDEIDLLKTVEVHMRRQVFYMNKKLSWNVCMNNQSLTPFGISSEKKATFPTFRTSSKVKISFMETSEGRLGLRKMSCIFQEI
jgi:hypothetical protein